MDASSRPVCPLGPRMKCFRENVPSGNVSPDGTWAQLSWQTPRRQTPLGQHERAQLGQGVPRGAYAIAAPAVSIAANVGMTNNRLNNLRNCDMTVSFAGEQQLKKIGTTRPETTVTQDRHRLMSLDSKAGPADQHLHQ